MGRQLSEKVFKKCFGKACPRVAGILQPAFVADSEHQSSEVVSVPTWFSDAADYGFLQHSELRGDHQDCQTSTRHLIHYNSSYIAGLEATLVSSSNNQKFGVTCHAVGERNFLLVTATQSCSDLSILCALTRRRFVNFSISVDAGKSARPV
jgi:hypothetical protein